MIEMDWCSGSLFLSFTSKRKEHKQKLLGQQQDQLGTWLCLVWLPTKKHFAQCPDLLFFPLINFVEQAKDPLGACTLCACTWWNHRQIALGRGCGCWHTACYLSPFGCWAVDSSIFSLAAAVQPIPCPWNSLYGKSVSLWFIGKDVVWNCIKGLQKSREILLLLPYPATQSPCCRWQPD